MSGPLLKRGKKLGQWKLRWYTLSIEGELTCHRQRSDVNAKPPLFALSLASAQVSVMPPARLEAELAESGVFGFVLEWGGDRAASAYAHRAAHASVRAWMFAQHRRSHDCRRTPGPPFLGLSRQFLHVNCFSC